MKPPIYHRMFGYNPGLLPNPQLAVLEHGVTTIEQARQKSGATIGYPGWGLIYHLLLSHLDRSREEIIIETGTNWGCTTIALAQALIDAGCRGRVLTFELDPENAARAQANLAAANVADRVELHLGDSRQTLPKELDSISGIRIAFLDASHLYNDVKQEFDTVLPKLSDDALVIFDNTYRIADEGDDRYVNGFLRDMPALYGGNLINMEFVSWYTPGLAIWQKRPHL
jgi:predicted O-methyltransferase YrrM